MKIKLHFLLRTLRTSARKLALTVTGVSAILGGTFTYNLHAETDLKGEGGIYTFTDAGATYQESTDASAVELPLEDASNAITLGNTVEAGVTQGPIVEDMTLNFESGEYTVKVFTVDGRDINTSNTDTTPSVLTINVAGLTNIVFGGAGRLYDWGRNANIYSELNVNIDTTGTVGGLMLIGRANGRITSYGDQNVTIKSGIVGAQAYSDTSASLSLGEKNVTSNGNVNYILGDIDASEDTTSLVFAGNIYGGALTGGGTSVTSGSINITLYSGSYKSIYGAGQSGQTHTGAVNINYYGGAIEGTIAADSGATVHGTATLNIGGALSSDKITTAGFDVFNVTSDGSKNGHLTIDSSVTIANAQSLNVATGAQLTIASDSSLTTEGSFALGGTLTNSGTLTLNGDLDLNAGSSIVNNGTLIFGNEVLIDLTDFGGSMGATSYEIFSGSESASFAGLSWSNVAGIVGMDSSTHSIEFNSALGTITIALLETIWENDTPADYGTLTWAVGGGSSSDDTDTFANNDNAVFSAHTVAEVSGAISANVVSIAANSSLTLGIAEAGGSLATNSFSLQDNSALTVATGVIRGGTTFTGTASSMITFATGTDISADHQFTDYAGSLTVSSGTLSITDNTRFSHLASLVLGENATLSSSQQLVSGVYYYFQNVSGGDNATLSVKFDGQSGDTPTNFNVRLMLADSFTGAIEVQEGQFNIAFGYLGGTKKILIGNTASSGINSGLYFNDSANTVHGEGITVVVKDGTTGYLAQDVNSQTLASDIVGAANTALRKIDAANLTLTGNMTNFLGELQVGANTMTIATNTATNISGISIANGTTFAVANGGHVATPELSVASGSGTLTVQSGGTLTLKNGLVLNANTLNLNVNSGATLNLHTQNGSSSETLNASVSAGATITAKDASTTSNSKLALTGSGQVTLNASEAGATVELNGAISGTAGLNIDGQDGQTINIGGNNSYQGDTTIRQATVNIAESAAGNALGKGTVTLADTTASITMGNVTLKAQATGSSTITGADKSFASNALSNATLNNINVGVGESAQLHLTSSTIGVGTTFTGEAGSSVRLTNSSIIFDQSSITVTEPSPVTSREVPGLETELDLSTMLQIKMDTTFNDIGSLILDGNLYIELNLSGDQFDSFHANVLNAGVAFVLDNDPDFTSSSIDIEGLDKIYIGLKSTESEYYELHTAQSAGVKEVDGSVTLFVMTVPEPSSVMLSMLALCGLISRRRRQAA